MAQLSTPVAIICYNRPRHVANVLSRILQVRPSVIYIISDGPRDDADEMQVAAVRRVIEDMVPSGVELVKDFAGQNLGLRDRVETGVHGLFAEFDRAIVVEDDCILSPSFFRFVDENIGMLSMREDFGAIVAYNPLRTKGVASGFLRTCFNHCWGWASTRRAWAVYDTNMHGGAESAVSSGLIGKYPIRFRKYYRKLFDRVAEGSVKSWAYRWTFSCWKNNMVSYVPNVNMVRNVGFDDGSNFAWANDPLASLSTGEIGSAGAKEMEVDMCRRDMMVFDRHIRGRHDVRLVRRAHLLANRLRRYI